MSQPAEIARLQQAIEQFESRQPRDLPDGVVEKIAELKSSLGDYAPSGADSPGSRAAAEVAGTDGTGEHYSKAARGTDQPSPGQREVMSVSQQIEQAASTIAEKLKGGGQKPPEPDASRA